MHLAGAVAFSDGNRSVKDTGLMMRAQMYSKGFGGLIISYAEDHGTAGNASVNEGLSSTMLGMKGIPTLAEDIMVVRDIWLAEYNHGRVHCTTVSTAGSEEIDRKSVVEGKRL